MTNASSMHPEPLEWRDRGSWVEDEYEDEDPLPPPAIISTPGSTNSRSVVSLDFGRLTKLYGRDEELSVLQRVHLEAVNNPHAPVQIVMVHGISGVGKSALIRKAFPKRANNDTNHTNHTDHTNHVILVEGKFEQYASHATPFAALTTAFHDLCRQVIPYLRKESRQADLMLVQQMQKQIGLSKNDNTNHPQNNQNALSTRYGFERLKISLRTLLRTICRCKRRRSVVAAMWLDDLQWADENSLEIFRYLAQDHQCHGLILIGAYRDDRESWLSSPHLRSVVSRLRQQESHYSTRTTDSSRSGTRLQSQLSRDEDDDNDDEEEENQPVFRFHANLTEIHVRALTRETMHEMIVDVLLSNLADDTKKHNAQRSNSISAASTCSSSYHGFNDANHPDFIRSLELAELVHTKSQGNAFCAIQYLHLLQQQGQLCTNPSRGEWEWKRKQAVPRTYDNDEDDRTTISSASAVSSLGDEEEVVVEAPTQAPTSAPTRKVAPTSAPSKKKYYSMALAVPVTKKYLAEWSLGESGEKSDMTSSDDNGPNMILGLVHVTKLQRLPRETIWVLKVASCLGSQFDLDVLALIHRAEVSTEELKRHLRFAENKMVIERVPNQPHNAGRYRFCHDRIHQAVYQLTPQGPERDNLHLLIGRTLRQMHRRRDSGSTCASSLHLNTRDPMWMLFTSVDQLNRGSSLIFDDYERRVLVEMNTEASDRAAEKSAFLAARDYLRVALTLLQKGGEDIWQQYRIALTLFTKLAAIECSLGDFQACQITIDEVLKNALRLGDKLPLYFTRIEMLSSQGRMTEAMNICVAVLGLLGESLKVSKIAVLGELIRTRRLLKGKTDEEILSLPDMIDLNKIAAMRVLSKLSHMAWWSQEKEMLTLVCLRIMSMTLSHGLHDASTHGFALFGAIVGLMGNYDQAHRFGLLSLTLLDRRNCRDFAARSVVITNVFTYHLKRPLHDCLDPCMEAYKMGMESGDVEYASQSCNAYSSIYLLCGLPLANVESAMRNFAEQMDTYNQVNALGLLRVFLQTVLNFMGRSNNDPLSFFGEAMTQEDLAEIESTKQMSTMVGYWLCRMMLAYHFGNYELAGKMASKIEIHGYTRTLRTVVTSYARHTLMALTMLSFVDAKGRRHQDRKQYLHQARKYIRIMESKEKNNNPNCRHNLLLVRAEYAAAMQQHSNKGASSVDEIRSMYDQAIAVATERGFVQDAALANQRAGFYLIKHSRQGMGQEYIRKSHACYREWGAHAKARQLEMSFDFLVPRRSHLTRSSTTKATTMQRQTR